MDTKNIFHKMITKLFEYIMAAELAASTNTPQIMARNKQESLYIHKKPYHTHSISAEAILFERIDAEFIIYQNTVDRTEITDDFDVLNWFQIQKIKFPMLTCFT